MRDSLRQSADVVVVAGTAAVLPLLAAVLPSGVVRVAFGLAFVLFLPGYALVSALFPGRRSYSLHGPETATGGGELLNRLVLSVGASIGIVVFVAAGFSLAGGRFTQSSVTLALALVTVTLCTTAVVRRARLPPTDRFAVAEFVDVERPTPNVTLLNVVVVLSLLFAAYGVWTTSVATVGDRPTAFYFAESDAGESANESVRVVVDNGRGETEYWYVAVVERYESGSEQPVSERVIDRRHRVIGPEETWRLTTAHDLPTGANDTDRSRLVLLLYRDDPGATPDPGTATRELHRWFGGRESGTVSDSN